MSYGFDTFVNLLVVTGEITLDTPLRIGSGRSNDATEPDLPVLKDARGRPVIPGSTLKGVIRSYMEAFVRGITERTKVEAVFDVLDNDAVSEQEKRFADKTDEEILAATPFVTRVFGSQHIAGSLLVRDANVIEAYWGERYLMRDGVAIDRDLGIAAHQKVFNFEVVPANTRFYFEVRLENATDAEIGLVLIGLREFTRGRIQIGGGRSRGLGWTRLVGNPIQLQLYENPEEYLFGGEGTTLSLELSAPSIAVYITAFKNELGIG